MAGRTIREKRTKRRSGNVGRSNRGVAKRGKTKVARTRAKPRTSKVSLRTSFLQDAMHSLEDRLRNDLGERLREELLGVVEAGSLSESYRWMDGDGSLIRPSDMDENHLRNAISFCARRLTTTLSRATYLEAEERFVTGLSQFLKEAKRRGWRV